MAKKVDSIKHPSDKRAHIPSKEEAGYEDANAIVQKGKKVLELPKNPVVHRGQGVILTLRRVCVDGQNECV